MLTGINRLAHEEIKKQMGIHFLIYLPIPFFIVKFLSFILNIFYKIKNHNIRLTPDKIYELKALAWTCDASLSRKILTQEYHYDLNKTVAVTLADYKKRRWL